MADAPNQPLTAAEYAAALTDLDEMIDGVDTSVGGYWTDDDARNHAYVVSNLTEAVLAVAKGIRLLAEPAPVETAGRGTFTIIEREGDEG